MSDQPESPASPPAQMQALGRCREVSGVLFKKRCPHPATNRCANCQKPVCRVHLRKVNNADWCIECARKAIKQDRRSMASLRDDPYFYWYYERHTWYDDSDYDDSDYELFTDSSRGSFDDAADHQWEGT